MFPYWSYFTHNWPPPGTGAAGPDAVDRTAGSHADEQLAHRVADRILTDPVIHGGQMEISVQNRVVILDGSVDSTAAKAAAGRQAWSTPGVHDVCNRLIPDA